ncbi:hypothetical protein HJFPF1_00322 [Paramyrothecium foliicola]|nr:hypothetical protein HJFPF1_00322 [Paramyrothecium foliicola]
MEFTLHGPSTSHCQTNQAGSIRPAADKMTTVAVTEKSGGDSVLVTPLWLLVVRVAQVLVAFIVLAISGDVIATSDLAPGAAGMGVATGVITWLVVTYLLLTEKVAALQVAYHIIAVLSLEGFMIIMWMATFAAAAALRSSAGAGKDVQSWTDKGLAELSAIAGMGAVVWLLFIASGVWTTVMFFKARKDGHFRFEGVSTSYQLENKGQQQPAAAAPTGFQAVQQQQPQGQYQAPYDPAQGAYPQQQPYEQQAYAAPDQGQYPPQGQYAPQDQQAYGQYPPQQPYQQPGSPEAVGHDYQNVPLQGQPHAPAPSHAQH